MKMTNTQTCKFLFLILRSKSYEEKRIAPRDKFWRVSVILRSSCHLKLLCNEEICGKKKATSRDTSTWGELYLQMPRPLAKSLRSVKDVCQSQWTDEKNLKISLAKVEVDHAGFQA
jgi:hypothetical protein